MNAATAIVAIGVFVGAFWMLRVVDTGAGALVIGRSAVAAMRDPSFDDDAREKAVRQASLRLFAAFGSISIRSALALAVSLVPVWLASVAGLTTVAHVTAFLARWDVIAATSVVMVAGHVLWTRLCLTR